MAVNRESWTKIGAIVGVACAFLGFCFGSLHSIMPEDSFVRGQYELAVFGIAGVICSFAFNRKARIVYLSSLTCLIFLLVSGAHALKYMDETWQNSPYAGNLDFPNGRGPLIDTAYRPQGH